MFNRQEWASLLGIYGLGAFLYALLLTPGFTPTGVTAGLGFIHGAGVRALWGGHWAPQWPCHGGYRSGLHSFHCAGNDKLLAFSIRLASAQRSTLTQQCPTKNGHPL